jgi:hypothetical protein
MILGVREKDKIFRNKNTKTTFGGRNTSHDAVQSKVKYRCWLHNARA